MIITKTAKTLEDGLAPVASTFFRVSLSSEYIWVEKFFELHFGHCAVDIRLFSFLNLILRDKRPTAGFISMSLIGARRMCILRGDNVAGDAFGMKASGLAVRRYGMPLVV